MWLACSTFYDAVLIAEVVSCRIIRDELQRKGQKSDVAYFEAFALKFDGTSSVTPRKGSLLRN
jgi:hypothetical protein